MDVLPQWGGEGSGSRHAEQCLPRCSHPAGTLAAFVVAERHGAVCGVRQILNYEPSWPRNKRLGNLLDNRKWIEGYHVLEDFSLSFDLQINPGQFQRAVQLAADHPRTPVIIGVGQTVQHADDLDEALDPSLLMCSAIGDATVDAGLRSIPNPQSLRIVTVPSLGTT